jgi:hypothetical protein
MQDTPPPPGVIEYLWLGLGALGAWLTGESGRIMIAGGLGGLVRWFFEARLRLLDAVVFVSSGMIAAVYLAPAALYMASHFYPMIANMPSAQFTFGHLVGLFGMAVGKIVFAVLTARGKAMVKEQDDAER